MCWLGRCGLTLSGAYTLAGMCHVALERLRVGWIVGFGVIIGEAWSRCLVAGPDGRYPL